MTDSIDYAHDSEFHDKLFALQEDYKSLLDKEISARAIIQADLNSCEGAVNLARQKVSRIIEETKFAINDLHKDFPSEEVAQIKSGKEVAVFLIKYKNRPQSKSSSYIALLELRNSRKNAIEEVNYYLNKIKELKSRTFNWKKDIKNKEKEIIEHLDKYDGTTYKKDNETYYLDYKVLKNRKTGFLNIKAISRPVGSSDIDQRKLIRAAQHLGTKRPNIDKLIEDFKYQNEKLEAIQDDAIKYRTEDNQASKANTKEDEAYKAYLEEKENIPAKKYKLPDTDNPKLIDKSPRIRKAIDRLNNESLVGRKFEFVWVEKQHNKHHASQMLALRFGIAHVHRTIIGTIKSHDVENRVELYLPQYNKVVNCSIEQDPDDGKWGISTFFQLRTDWSVCENSTKNVPSGLAQEIDMKFNLTQLVEFHNLIMENYKAVIAA